MPDDAPVENRQVQLTVTVEVGWCERADRSVGVTVEEDQVSGRGRRLTPPG
jgi:hypothetical protein